MTFVKPSFVILALALQFMTARADHTIHFVNHCPFDVTPMWKDNADGATNHQASQLSPGQTTTATIPEEWESGRFYAQDPHQTCLRPDGARCTLVECSFAPPNQEPRFDQCNLSLVSGYNLPTELSFSDSSCSGRACMSSTCPETDAWLQGPQGCNGCLTQCNTIGVGMTITYCPAGSTVPNFGQSTSPAPAPKPPSPPPPKAQPAPKPPAPSPPKAQPATSPPSEPAANPETRPKSTQASKPASTQRCPKSKGRSRRHARLHGRRSFGGFDHSH